MTAQNLLTFLGSPGSPYTRKMLAILRYRRIAYRFVIGSHRSDLDLPKPKVALLPTFYLPNEAGELEAVVDSTPILRRLEREFKGRRVVPTDPALAFIDYLIEDFADEWLTKAMFHYRWHFADDARKAEDQLPRWSIQPQSDHDLEPIQRMFAERQISRLYVVGSNATTAPVIEASYQRVLLALREHLARHAFVLGARPSACDFALYGQLTQLTHFDPTPQAIALKLAPRVVAWVDILDDLSGLEPDDGDWLASADLPQSLRPLLEEIGRVYTPVMRANARALTEGLDSVVCEVDGRPWTQAPFAYQGRCLAWLRDEYKGLTSSARQAVDQALEGTGCHSLFQAL
jgi:glutathione S-transferase